MFEFTNTWEHIIITNDCITTQKIFLLFINKYSHLMELSTWDANGSRPVKKFCTMLSK